MVEYKYLHIMIAGDSVHNINVINMINKSDKFNELDHVFVIKLNQSNIYNNFEYDNVIIDNDISKFKKLREYIKKSDFIILHGMHLNCRQLFNLSRKELNKIVWVVWGHDLYVVEKYNNLIECFKTFLKKCIWSLKAIQYRKLNSIGVGFKYDSFRIIEGIGSKIKILNLPYFQSHEILDKGLMTNNSSEYNVRIMLGHSAFPFLNHIENLNRLERYKNENIKILIPLSYGHDDYAEQVEKYALEKFGEKKVEIIKNKMSYEEYIHFISGVDIAILDYKHQSALGNVYLLTYFGKKLYLHPDGIIKKSALLEGWSSYDVSSIGNVDYDIFKQECDCQSILNMNRFAKYYFDKNIAEYNWYNSLYEISKGHLNGE